MMDTSPSVEVPAAMTLSPLLREDEDTSNGVTLGKGATVFTTADGRTGLASMQQPTKDQHAHPSGTDCDLLPADAVTREWFVYIEEEARTYHVTVADCTAVCPKSPRIVIGVDGRRWPVPVRYGCSAHPLCGPPCTYTWQEGTHTFELALDSMTLQPWRRSLVLFCDGREVQSASRKPVFWLRRYSTRMIWGLFWLILGVMIHVAVRAWTRGDASHLHATILVLVIIGIALATTVLVLPCALGLSYFVVGCIGMLKFGIGVARGEGCLRGSANRASRLAYWPSKFQVTKYLKLRQTSDIYDV